MAVPEIPLTSTAVFELISDAGPLTATGPIRAPLELGNNIGFGWVQADLPSATVTAVEAIPTAELTDGYMVAGALYEASLNESGRPRMCFAGVMGVYNASSPDDDKLFNDIRERATPILLEGPAPFSHLSALVRRIIAFNTGDATP